MKFNRLGQTGLFVSELCMGTWGFSGRNYFGGAIGTLSQKDATGFIGRALEARINFIDTANVYSYGDSEAMTGQALKELGGVPIPGSPEDFDKVIADETAKWEKVVRGANISIE